MATGVLGSKSPRRTEPLYLALYTTPCAPSPSLNDRVYPHSDIALTLTGALSIASYGRGALCAEAKVSLSGNKRALCSEGRTIPYDDGAVATFLAHGPFFNSVLPL
jgi:hypothetical protein